MNESWWSSKGKAYLTYIPEGHNLYLTNLTLHAQKVQQTVPVLAGA